MPKRAPRLPRRIVRPAFRDLDFFTTRRAAKQLASIRERHVPATDHLLSVLGPIALDDDLGARQQRLLRPAEPEERVRGPTFDHPALHLTVWLGYVEMNP